MRTMVIVRGIIVVGIAGECNASVHHDDGLEGCSDLMGYSFGCFFGHD